MTVLSSGLPLLLDERFKLFSRFILVSKDSMAAIWKLWLKTLPRRECLKSFLAFFATCQPSGWSGETTRLPLGGNGTQLIFSWAEGQDVLKDSPVSFLGAVELGEVWCRAMAFSQMRRRPRFSSIRCSPFVSADRMLPKRTRNH